MSESMELLRLFESDGRMNKYQNLFKQLIYLLLEENIEYVIIGVFQGSCHHQAKLSGL